MVRKHRECLHQSGRGRSIDHLCSSRTSCFTSASTLTATSLRSFSLSALCRRSSLASASLILRCSLRHLRARARAFLCLRNERGVGCIARAGKDRVGKTHTNVSDWVRVRTVPASVAADVQEPLSRAIRRNAVVLHRQRPRWRVFCNKQRQQLYARGFSGYSGSDKKRAVLSARTCVGAIPSVGLSS